jgi:hypothetical protein
MKLPLVVALIACATGCTPNSVCKLSGPINDPSNRTLRRSIMSFGLGQFCTQMIKRNAPLKLSDDTPVIGRFYPQHCTQRELDNGDLWVQFDGWGYAWTNLSKKVTFTSAATVTYNQDFKCDPDSNIYAYFDRRAASPPDFRVVQIEQPVANLVQNWIQPFADNFGRQMLAGKLGEGFTVIHDTDANDDFDLGHLPLGKRPFHPFQTHGSDKIVYENLRTEVHQNQRDFIGPISIEDNGRALYLTARLDGIPAVDLFVIPKQEADAALSLYFNYGPSGPLAYPPRFSEVVQAGADYRRTVPLGPGMYYVVIDNTPSAGQVAPPVSLFDDRAAVVNYVIQIGDAP